MCNMHIRTRVFFSFLHLFLHRSLWTATSAKDGSLLETPPQERSFRESKLGETSALPAVAWKRCRAR